MVNLTPDQINAKNILNEWMNDPKAYIASLTGGAGTGKTFTLNEFLKDKSGVVVSAPTHKAKKVICSVTGKSSSTIQALLGLRPDVEMPGYDINNPLFSIIGNQLLLDYKLAVIDEASMVNTELCKLITTLANDNKVKVLFVGDACQIPPVKEKSAPALEIADYKAILTKPVRQKNSNPCNDLLAIIREDVLNNTDEFWNYIKQEGNDNKFNPETREGFAIYSNSSTDEQQMFANHMIVKFQSEKFKLDSDYCKYIAWTNENVMQFNKYIRAKRFNEVNLPLVKVDDLFMCYKTITKFEKGRNKLSTVEEIVSNSEDYEVVSCTLGSSMDIHGYECVIKSNSEKYTRTVFIVSPTSYPLFKEQHDDLRDKALKANYKDKKLAWENYYAFKNYFLLAETIGSGSGRINKDFDYGYGITTHKSQGSTYQHVFVNVVDIYKNRDQVDRRKLLYVAASRTSKTLHLLV